MAKLNYTPIVLDTVSSFSAEEIAAAQRVCAHVSQRCAAAFGKDKDWLSCKSLAQQLEGAAAMLESVRAAGSRRAKSGT